MRVKVILGLLLALGVSLLIWGCDQLTPTPVSPSPTPSALETRSPTPPSPTPPSPTPPALETPSPTPILTPTRPTLTPAPSSPLPSPMPHTLTPTPTPGSPTPAVPASSSPSPTPPVLAPTPTPETRVLAYLDPAAQDAEPGQQIVVKVMVRPGSWGVSAAEVSLAFPPGVLQALAVEPGGLLGPQPLVGLEELDNVGGRVRYALARVGATSPPTPEGAIASIILRVLGGAQKGEYALGLEVEVADQNFQGLTDIQTRGALIRVK